jgi:hypothetical protein
MTDPLLRPLAGWESFYVIIGSAGAALTGLQFLVVAFVADRNTRVNTAAVNAFATPAIVHFGVVLLVACALSAPWETLGSVAAVLGVCGGGGVAYTLLVAYRAARQTGYTVVIEDWIWHVGLPLLAYGAIVAAGISLSHVTTLALFIVAASSLGLLFIGIHHGWDTVIWTLVQSADQGRGEESGS